MLTRRKLFTQSSGAVASVGLGLDTLTGAEKEGAGAGHDEALFSVGLIADAQYVDAEPKGVRHYRNSIEKLEAAVEGINKAKVAFSIHLGDLIDREFESFDAILRPLAALDRPIHQILGNHDFDVPEEKKSEVPKKLGMESRYYAFSEGGVRFVFLDGTEVSTFVHPPGSDGHAAAVAWLEELTQQGRKNAKPWNAGIGETQLAWLEGQLEGAATSGEKVVISCHYPILPDNGHNLWNDTEVLDLIDRHEDTVLAWINGHNHAGNYAERNGVHYVTVHGMVDTPDSNAWAILEVLPGAKLRIRGKGREPDRILA